jgi:hypothetical protein
MQNGGETRRGKYAGWISAACLHFRCRLWLPNRSHSSLAAQTIAQCSLSWHAIWPIATNKALLKCANSEEGEIHAKQR